MYNDTKVTHGHSDSTNLFQIIGMKKIVLILLAFFMNKP